jgi:peptide deformylase
MKKVINCNQSDNPLINKKAKEVSVEEGLAIAEELFQILNKRGDGIGLAANQVGIDAQVAVVNVTEPLVLINPKYIKKEVEIMYGEGCLSYPGQAIKTKRYRDVIIQTAQSESGWYFSGAEIPADESRGSWEVERKKKDSDLRLLESVCVQHEIDHLNGITIHDREIKLEPTKVEKKIGRNQKVLIACGPDSKVVKYKKAIPLLENGWTLVESE